MERLTPHVLICCSLPKCLQWPALADLGSNWHLEAQSMFPVWVTEIELLPPLPLSPEVLPEQKVGVSAAGGQLTLAP